MTSKHVTSNMLDGELTENKHKDGIANDSECKVRLCSQGMNLNLHCRDTFDEKTLRVSFM